MAPKKSKKKKRTPEWAKAKSTSQLLAYLHARYEKKGKRKTRKGGTAKAKATHTPAGLPLPQPTSAAEQAAIYRAVAKSQEFPKQQEDKSPNSGALVPARSQKYFRARSGKQYAVSDEMYDDMHDELSRYQQKVDADKKEAAEQLSKKEKEVKEKDQTLQERRKKALGEEFTRLAESSWKLRNLQKIYKVAVSQTLPQNASKQDLRQAIYKSGKNPSFNEEYDKLWKLAEENVAKEFGGASAAAAAGATGQSGEGKSDALNTSQIDKAMSENHEYQMTVARDQGLPSVNSSKRKGWIKNLDPAHRPGYHWVAIMVDPKGAYYFDPFGDPCPLDIVAQIVRVAPPQAPFRESTVVRQRESSSRCGYHCMLFLEKMFAGKSFGEATGSKRQTTLPYSEEEAKSLESRLKDQIGGGALHTPWSGKHQYSLWYQNGHTPIGSPVNGVDHLAMAHRKAYASKSDETRKNADVNYKAGLNDLAAHGTWEEKLDAQILLALLSLRGK